MHNILSYTDRHHEKNKKMYVKCFLSILEVCFIVTKNLGYCCETVWPSVWSKKITKQTWHDFHFLIVPKHYAGT